MKDFEDELDSESVFGLDWDIVWDTEAVLSGTEQKAYIEAGFYGFESPIFDALAAERFGW